MTPEEDPWVKREKEIFDLIIQIDKSKQAISFYPVPPGSSSEGTSFWATMFSVPDERAVIDHVVDKKFEFNLIDWGTNFAVYPYFTIKISQLAYHIITVGLSK